MNMKRIAGVFIFLCSLLTAGGQSIYHFTYTLNRPGAVAEEAFFVRYDDGTGFARIRTGTVLREIKLQEEFPGTATGNPDYSRVFYKVTGMTSIDGMNGTTGPTFWFRRVAGLDYEPWGVKEAAGADTTGLVIFSTPPKLLQLAELKKDPDFVLRFFKPADIFYRNLFVIKPKGLNAEEAKTKIYLLIVANTVDKTIGPSCKKDMDRMVETFNDLARTVGITCVPKTIDGKAISKAKLLAEIAALKPDPRDILVFYYTGHGFRKQKDNRRFPYIDLRSNENEDYNVASMNMEDIFELFKAKPGRVKLVLSDCCNSVVTSSNAISNPLPNKKGIGFMYSELNFRALFFNKPTAIIMSAASAGELATSNNEFGGFFSYYFKSSLETSCGQFKTNVSWDQLFQEVKKNTIYKAEHTYCSKPYIPENICKQTPVMK